MPESCLDDPAMGYSPADVTSTQAGSVCLVTMCTIGDASHVKYGIYAAANGRLVTPVRYVLLDGASRTTPSSESGDSGCPGRQGVSSCIDVLSGSGCPSSSALFVPSGVLVTLIDASI